MPGRHRQSGAAEPKLSRKQSSLAGRVLKTMWTPEQHGVAPLDEERARILCEVNAAFVREGHAANYSERKLNDAISNRMYTWRLAQRRAIPDSWAAGARSIRRKRTQDDVAEGPKLEDEQGMVTPRGTASTIEGFACDAEIFGLPVVQDDFACTAIAPGLPADMQIMSISTTIDESWNVLATLDDSDMLPSPPTSPMQSPTPRDASPASLCGMDNFSLTSDSMCSSMTSDSMCGTMDPLDDLDLLLERAQVDINLDDATWDKLSAEHASAGGEPAAEPPRAADLAPVNDSKSAAARSGSATAGFETEAENPSMASKEQNVVDSRTQSASEPHRKLRKMGAHTEWSEQPGSWKAGKTNQSLLDAQVAAFHTTMSPLDTTATLAPQRRVLQTLSTRLNSQQTILVPGSAPAA